MGFIENVNKLASELPDSGFIEYTQRLESLEAKEEFTATEKSKLQNIQSEATKNDTDSNLKNRENHTGTQSLDTITETATKKIFTNVEKEQLQLLDGHNHDLRYYKKSESDEQMSNKSDTGHAHDDRYFTETEITNLLNAYALALNTFTKEEVNQFLNTKENANNKNMANGYAGLDASGRISPSNLPAMSIMDVFGASSEAGMLALSNVGIGDLCVRGDLSSNNVFLCKQTPSSDINNWIQLTTSANVSSVNGKIGTVNLNSSDIGLENVDNTRDADKPVSTLQQEALNLRVLKTQTINGKELSSDVTLNKSDIGLPNVDNTADANKEVLSATKLKTARAINGVPFNGEADITIEDGKKITEHFSKQNKKAVVFTKTAPAGLSVLPNKVELPNGEIANNTSTVSLSLNSNLDTGSKVAGTDYYVYCTASNTYNISTNKTKTDGTIIGGFHYGLTTEAEAPTGNKTEADMVQIRGINAYSFWDLKYRPNNENTNAMVKVGSSWYDIYQMDSEYGINKYSRAGATIAGGTADYGRAIPKIPLAYGGNGTVTYGKFTWFQAGEVAVASGKRKISYNEFGSIAYGVTEGVSSSTNGYETVAGRIEHYPHLTSKYGIEQVSGTQWIWGADVGGNYGTTDWAWRDNTDSRGQIYSTSNNPTAVLLGGYRGDGANAGSRASGWLYYVWASYWNFGCRFACDHLELV